MQNKSNFTKLYENYKRKDDKVLMIEGERYFKIIKKEKIVGLEIITLPNEVFDYFGNTLKDECGNIFQVGNAVHFSFRNEIPEWYLKTVSVVLKNITISELGEYVHFIK